jgi:hypothetical protein
LFVVKSLVFGGKMYYGSHLLFSTMPLWAIALLCYVIMAVPIQVLRNHYEGMQYQVAWSADFGCSALVAIALVGASILQRGVLLPDFLGSRGFHSLAVVVAVAVGVVWTKLDWHTQWGDRYHHAVVAPVLTYLLFTLLPVIFWGGGQRWRWWQQSRSSLSSRYSLRSTFGRRG